MVRKSETTKVRELNMNLNEAYSTINNLIYEKKSSYQRINIHKDNNDLVHTMIIGLKAYSSIIWHKSKNKGLNTYHVLEGNLLVALIEDKFINKYELSKHTCPISIDRKKWRSLTNNTEKTCFFLEICPGPYFPNSTLWNFFNN